MEEQTAAHLLCQRSPRCRRKHRRMRRRLLEIREGLGSSTRGHSYDRTEEGVLSGVSVGM